MNPRGETKNWRLGPAAALLLAYLLVLQSIAFGVSTSARGAALFSGQICVSKSSGPLDSGGGDPTAPARRMRHGDTCCVFHSAGFGAATTPSPFVGEPPPVLSYVAARLAYDETQARREPATPPLGSRAPPTIV